jgi:hypothetical protein
VKWIWQQPLVGALGFLVVLPVAVLVGSSIGVPTVHWSGVAMANAKLLPNADSVHQGDRGELVGTRQDRLDSVQNSVTYLDHPGLQMVYPSWARDQVIVGTTALSHGLFSDLGDRFGADVAVEYSPFQPLACDDPPCAGPSWSERHQPLATWFVLVTGFPYYLAAAVLIELVVFGLWDYRAARRRTDRVAPSDPAP